MFLLVKQRRDQDKKISYLEQKLRQLEGQDALKETKLANIEKAFSSANAEIDSLRAKLLKKDEQLRESMNQTRLESIKLEEVKFALDSSTKQLKSLTDQNLPAQIGKYK